MIVFAHRLILIFLFLGFTMSGLCLSCPYNICSSLYYGDTDTNSFTIQHEIHGYSFVAEAGDKVIIRCNAITGTFRPRLELYDGKGQFLALDDPNSDRAEIFNVLIPDGGTCSFLCLDAFGSGRGQYAVSLQSTNRPGDPLVISHSGARVDALTGFSQMKVYRFFSEIGDSIAFQMISLGDINPKLDLFTSNGIRIRTSQDEYEAVIVIDSMPLAGMFYLFASDGQGDETGLYNLMYNNLLTDADDWPAGQPVFFELSQNYPNPFNPITRIDFSLARHAHVTLDIYNILGEKVKSLVAADLPAGFYSCFWDGNNGQGVSVASGVYSYRLSSDGNTQTRKMILTR